MMKSLSSTLRIKAFFLLAFTQLSSYWHRKESENSVMVVGLELKSHIKR